MWVEIEIEIGIEFEVVPGALFSPGIQNLRRPSTGPDRPP